MNNKKEIYLIRHTAPKVEKGICYGQTDLDLASSFEDEKNRIISLIPNNFDIVFSSPLKRCYQLAKSFKTVAFVTLNELLEINFGDWELKTYTELTNNEFNDWCTDFINKIPPNGESYKEMFERVKAGWEIILNSKYQNIAIVTHSGVIRIIFALILEIDLKYSFRIEQKYGAVNKINVDGEIISIEYTNR
ncbi:MAG TPA: alpha-ribazole phosphatase [Ignavibacteriales bacterium]|nr:alpha-ribazole phosphatase [Ignavibacteriales bacterium]HPD67787.1 alpha-ribazole phosphatase [Ignavibacteriales bacterium]HPP33169.1 alpha-ribazole phosphatase [Ignavibacteriales bacterium]HRR17845.1 alpha-ribazole phosphatase [Ignavibacteriales bacterium]HRT99337.1 alpha-ribazole phosphatase [Ignavibacteriales bacterium]